MTQIKPTIGRVVWFYPHGHREGSLPHAAMIAFVHSDSLVNLGVLDPNGRSYNETSVSLIQDGDPAPDSGRYATWMPFQIGQAKQTEISGTTDPVLTDLTTGYVESVERDPEPADPSSTTENTDGAVQQVQQAGE